MTKHDSAGLARNPASLRQAAERASTAVLIIASLMLLAVDRIQPTMIEQVRVTAADAAAPLLEALAQPVATGTQALDDVSTLATVFAENARLKEENARLRAWYEASRQLEAENRSLRRLQNVAPEPGVRFTAARVIADRAGMFVKSVLITAGHEHEVEKGQAVVAGAGLVGRVTEAGRTTARVLLITDINSRIPVVLQESRHRAVAAGANQRWLRLAHLPADAEVAIGDRIVTSGTGGLFPPGLGVGVVAAIEDGVVLIQPAADLSRLDHVRLVDYGIARNLEEDRDVVGAATR